MEGAKSQDLFTLFACKVAFYVPKIQVLEASILWHGMNNLYLVLMLDTWF